MRALLLRGGGATGGGGRGGATGGNELKKGNQETSIESLQQYIQKLEEDSDSALLHQVKFCLLFLKLY